MHDRMKSIIICLLGISFLAYTFLLYCDLPVEETQTGSEISEGKKLWQENNCGSCHQIYGLGGYLGPDLTNVYSLKGESYIRAFISGGNKSMPAFRFSDNEMDHIINYLMSIDASGTADPRSFKITYDGNIEQ